MTKSMQRFVGNLRYGWQRRTESLTCKLWESKEVRSLPTCASKRVLGADVWMRGDAWTLFKLLDEEACGSISKDAGNRVSTKARGTPTPRTLSNLYFRYQGLCRWLPALARQCFRRLLSRLSHDILQALGRLGVDMATLRCESRAMQELLGLLVMRLDASTFPKPRRPELTTRGSEESSLARAQAIFSQEALQEKCGYNHCVNRSVLPASLSHISCTTTAAKIQSIQCMWHVSAGHGS